MNILRVHWAASTSVCRTHPSPPLRTYFLAAFAPFATPLPFFFFRLRGGIWETQDVYGDRQAEAAAKSVQRRSTAKTTPTKTTSSLSLLRRSNKEKVHVVRQRSCSISAAAAAAHAGQVCSSRGGVQEEIAYHGAVQSQGGSRFADELPGKTCVASRGETDSLKAIDSKSTPHSTAQHQRLASATMSTALVALTDFDVPRAPLDNARAAFPSQIP